MPEVDDSERNLDVNELVDTYFRVEDLQRVLKAFNLPFVGRKSELLERVLSLIDGTQYEPEFIVEVKRKITIIYKERVHSEKNRLMARVPSKFPTKRSAKAKANTRTNKMRKRTSKYEEDDDYTGSSKTDSNSSSSSSSSSESALDSDADSDSNSSTKRGKKPSFDSDVDSDSNPKTKKSKTRKTKSKDSDSQSDSEVSDDERGKRVKRVLRRKPRRVVSKPINSESNDKSDKNETNEFSDANNKSDSSDSVVIRKKSKRKPIHINLSSDTSDEETHENESNKSDGELTSAADHSSDDDIQIIDVIPAKASNIARENGSNSASVATPVTPQTPKSFISESDDSKLSDILSTENMDIDMDIDMDNESTLQIYDKTNIEINNTNDQLNANNIPIVEKIDGITDKTTIKSTHEKVIDASNNKIYSSTPSLVITPSQPPLMIVNPPPPPQVMAAKPSHTPQVSASHPTQVVSGRPSLPSPLAAVLSSLQTKVVSTQPSLSTQVAATLPSLQPSFRPQMVATQPSFRPQMVATHPSFQPSFRPQMVATQLSLPPQIVTTQSSLLTQVLATQTSHANQMVSVPQMAAVRPLPTPTIRTDPRLAKRTNLTNNSSTMPSVSSEKNLINTADKNVSHITVNSNLIAKSSINSIISLNSKSDDKPKESNVSSISDVTPILENLTPKKSYEQLPYQELPQWSTPRMMIINIPTIETKLDIPKLPSNYSLTIMDPLLTLSKIRERFTENSLDSSEIEAIDQNFRLSLICPITNKRITIPGRSKICKHVDCFDVSAFLQMNVRKVIDKWKCPKCKQPSPLKDLLIDGLIKHIIKSTECSCEAVIFDKTAIWEPESITSDKFNSDKQCDGITIKTDIDIIELDDDDDNQDPQNSLTTFLEKGKSLESSLSSSLKITKRTITDCAVVNGVIPQAQQQQSRPPQPSQQLRNQSQLQQQPKSTTGRDLLNELQSVLNPVPNTNSSIPTQPPPRIASRTASQSSAQSSNTSNNSSTTHLVVFNKQTSKINEINTKKSNKSSKTTDIPSLPPKNSSKWIRTHIHKVEHHRAYCILCQTHVPINDKRKEENLDIHCNGVKHQSLLKINGHVQKPASKPNNNAHNQNKNSQNRNIRSEHVSRWLDSTPSDVQQSANASSNANITQRSTPIGFTYQSQTMTSNKQTSNVSSTSRVTPSSTHSSNQSSTRSTTAPQSSSLPTRSQNTNSGNRLPNPMPQMSAQSYMPSTTSSNQRYQYRSGGPPVAHMNRMPPQAHCPPFPYTGHQYHYTVPANTPYHYQNYSNTPQNFSNAPQNYSNVYYNYNDSSNFFHQ